MHFHMEMRGQANTEEERECDGERERKRVSSLAGMTAGEQRGGREAAGGKDVVGNLKEPNT